MFSAILAELVLVTTILNVLACLLIMVSTVARVSVCDLDPRDLRLPGNTFFVHFLSSFLHLLFVCGYRSVTQGPYRHGKLRAVPTLRYIYNRPFSISDSTRPNQKMWCTDRIPSPCHVSHTQCHLGKILHIKPAMATSNHPNHPPFSFGIV